MQNPINPLFKCKTSAIIVAAGQGSRMKTDVNKPYLMLCNKPILAHTLDVFERTVLVSEIILVIHKNDEELLQKTVLDRFRAFKVTAVVHGGSKRQDSVYLGLLKTAPDTEVILVHDGARPLITPEIIETSIESAVKYGAACVGVPVKETIKHSVDTQVIGSTLDRTCLWSAQTPQVFRRDILVKAYENARHTGFCGTDDAMLAEKLGYPVRLVKGCYSNIKITTPEDLIYAEAILRCRSKVYT